MTAPFDATGWRTARRYGVPAPMVAEATRRRLAGDWRGSCEAAAFDVQFDLDDVRTGFRGQVEEDLHHLAPDLVRWHLPRIPRFDGVLAGNAPVVLARYGFLERVSLWVRTPDQVFGPQRVELHVGPSDRVGPRRGRHPDSGGPVPVLDVTVSWTDARARWDARAGAEWRHRLDGLVDRELLRLGMIGLPGLHPLVRACLFPDYPGDPDEYRPMPQVEADLFRVRCRGAWHRVGWRDSRITALDHTAEEARRELVMDSLGGQVPRCFTVVRSWRAGGNQARPLRELRRHALLALRHCDLGEVTRLLDLGVDPGGLRDGAGGDPLHYLANLNSLPVLHRLLAAGLDVNRRARFGRTPLACALFGRAPAAIVAGLLDAGADPTVVDDLGERALHQLRAPDAAAYLPRLLAAGLDLEARDGRGCTPLHALLFADAPAATVRALWQAGADPSARTGRDRLSAVDLARELRRDDLKFLR